MSAHCGRCGHREGDRVTMLSGTMVHAATGEPVKLHGTVVANEGFRPAVGGGQDHAAWCHVVVWDDGLHATPLPNGNVQQTS